MLHDDEGIVIGMVHEADEQVIAAMEEGMSRN